MKRFFALLVVFIVGLVIVDVSFGIVMHRVIAGATDGDIGKDNYIADRCNDDLLVFGSSRGEYHYNTAMMTDSLGMTCYNCAQNACGSIFAYARLLMVEERYRPKFIIFDVYPGSDYLAKYKTIFTSPWLKLHYDRSGVDSLLWLLDETERIKMLSGIHRYKAQIKSVGECLQHNGDGDKYRGYVPYDIEFNSLETHSEISIYFDRTEGYVYDEAKLACMKKFAERTRDDNVIYVVSPIWYGMDTLALDTIKRICAENGKLLLDYSNDPKYVHNDSYFRNGTHLNARGADEFTRDLMRRLRELGFFDEPAEGDDDETSAKLNVSRASTVKVTSPYLK